MTAFRTATLAFPIGGDAALVHEVTAGIDVAAFTEARNAANQPVDLATILGDGWDVAQDTSSGSRAGSALVVSKASGLELLRWRLTQMNEATSHGGGVQARYLLHAVLRAPRRHLWRRRTHVLVLHAPTPETGKQGEALAVVRRLVARLRRLRRRWIVLGDPNQLPADFARAIAAPHHFGDKPMAICWSAGWGEVSTGARRIAGSDHAVLTMRERWRV